MSLSSATIFPARLHILLAKDVPFGVIIRRGPSKRTCTIGWNREDDTFSVGQWLKGRIYERRSDLSPDGRHMIYFAMNGKWHSEVKGAWTAISRTPYLKAVGLWAKGDCWHGGGLFIKSHQYWINGGEVHTTLRAPSSLQRVTEYPDYVCYGGECPGVYYLRLKRDGWRYICRNTPGKLHSIDIFEKPFCNNYILRKYAHATCQKPKGKGCYYDEHQVENTKTGEKISGTHWEWADIDRNRLVFAENGKLFARRFHAVRISDPEELYDFNSMEFTQIKAPY